MVPTEESSDPTDPTLRQRAEDLHERALLGGAFYLISWGLVAWYGGVWHAHPRLAIALAGVFLALWAARLAIREWHRDRPDRSAASMRRQWAVLLVTAGLWGGLSGWALWDDDLGGARTLTFIATVSLSMAFAQIFSVNPRLALLGTGMVFLPMLVVVLVAAQEPGVALVMVLNLVYLVAVIGRSHREYEGKLALDRELREQRDRFARQSRTDALTGLANRGHFQTGLEQQVAAARTDGTPLVLLISDLDHFKSVNDRFGHAAGDRCLREVAFVLAECFPGDDALVARLGGEEFGVLVRGDAVAAAALVGETFRARVDRLKVEGGDGAGFGITVSVGLATFDPSVHADGDMFYAAADAALYRAKHAGRNRLEAA
jgi:diguanylate cyclase (GGDEF)-like protein